MCWCFMLLGKIVAYLGDTVVMLLGLLLVGLGTFIKLEIQTIAQYLSELPVDFSIDLIVIILIVPGVVLFLIGFSGCIGKACKVLWLIITNAVGISIIAAGTIYLLVIITQFLEQSSEIFNTVLTDMFNDPNHQNGTFQGIEYTFQCCGVNGVDSYTSAGMLVPPTCCQDEFEAVTLPPEIADLYPDIQCHSVGCHQVIVEEVVNYTTIIRNVFIGILCIEVFIVAFDIIYAYTLRKRK